MKKKIHKNELIKNIFQIRNSKIKFANMQQTRIPHVFFLDSFIHISRCCRSTLLDCWRIDSIFHLCLLFGFYWAVWKRVRMRECVIWYLCRNNSTACLCVEDGQQQYTHTRNFFTFACSLFFVYSESVSIVVAIRSNGTLFCIVSHILNIVICIYLSTEHYQKSSRNTNN